MRGISRLLDKLLASQARLSSLSFVDITVAEYTYYYTSNNDAPTVLAFGVPRTDCSPHVTLNSNTVTTFTTSHKAETKKQPPWNHHLTNHVFKPSRSSPQQFSLPSAISKPQITLYAYRLNLNFCSFPPADSTYSPSFSLLSSTTLSRRRDRTREKEPREGRAVCERCSVPNGRKMYYVITEI